MFLRRACARRSADRPAYIPWYAGPERRPGKAPALPGRLYIVKRTIFSFFRFKGHLSIWLKIKRFLHRIFWRPLVKFFPLVAARDKYHGFRKISFTLALQVIFKKRKLQVFTEPKAGFLSEVLVAKVLPF